MIHALRNPAVKHNYSSFHPDWVWYQNVKGGVSARGFKVTKFEISLEKYETKIEVINTDSETSEKWTF